jgi:hypothetical protein
LFVAALLLTPIMLPCAVAAVGVQISMLRRSDKTKSFGSAGDLVATVEQQDGVVSGSTADDTRQYNLA